ncbi:hypothetical protein [Tenacibaculum finnmarkense]|uniref:hypothetical protein n=1 Tax=Tenacibaculum finnmarkense TaxID=2781243 RepID=UPI001EFA4DC9|nr:hypothetical protein [Tenacibaculum finnmarkense]MCG8732471.1 hypothetical protein [Tenacibaculum finnmarkense]
MLASNHQKIDKIKYLADLADEKKKNRLMTTSNLEHEIIEEGVECKLISCQKYLDKYFIGFSEKNTIKDIKTHTVKYAFEEETINNVYELSDFVRDAKLMIKIAHSREFDPSLIMYLEENKKGLNTLLRYLKTKTKLIDILQTYFKEWDSFTLEKYNERVIYYFKCKS